MKKILVFISFFLFSCHTPQKEVFFGRYGKESEAIYMSAAQDLANGLCPRLEFENTESAFSLVFTESGGKVDENWLADFSQLVKKLSRGKVRIEAPCRAEFAPDVPGVYFTLCFGEMAQGVKLTPEEPLFQFEYPVIAWGSR